MKKAIKEVLELMLPPLLFKSIEDCVYFFGIQVNKRKLKDNNKLHLACGSNIIEGWANIDLDRGPKIISLDLTKPLPVEDGKIDYIYSEHFIEHISREEALLLLKECYRTLRPEGVVRITTPNLKKLISEYALGNLEEWKDVNWLPLSSCRLINEGMRWWGHQFLYDENELKTILGEAGFDNLKILEWKKSEHKELEGLECRPYHEEIIIEATR